MEIKTEAVDGKSVIYQELLGTKPDAIFILSGGISRKGTNEELLWKPTSYASEDHMGLFGGGKARVLAAAKVAPFFPETRIVVNSSVAKPGKPIEFHSKVYADELMKAGVPNEQIILQTESNNTATELLMLMKLSKENDWKEVVVLTNDYHVPRVVLMFDNLGQIISNEIAPDLPELKESFLRNTRVRFVAAEDVLSVVSPHYQRLIARAQEGESFRRRLQAESNGIDDILKGTYRLRLD